MVAMTRIFDLGSAAFQTLGTTYEFSPDNVRLVDSGAFARVLEVWADHDIITAEEARATIKYVTLCYSPYQPA